LVEQGVASKEDIDLQARRLREIKELFLKHALMLTDIHVCLELGARVSPIKLIEWREGKELYDSAMVYEEGERKKSPVRPDAFLTLEDTRRPEGKNQAYFLLEADRSTVTNKRFQRKIKAYAAYFEQELHTERYGIKSARVVTVTLTEARALNLCKAAREVVAEGDQKFYYFAPVEHFSFEEPEQVFDDIFMTPRDFEADKRYSFIPPLAR
jgi:hypothetical protein